MLRSLTVIHGVHRSGTSLLVHGLRALGAEVGDFAETRTESNPDGHGEYPAVRRFNDRLLARIGASWDNWGFRAGLVDWDAVDLAPCLDEAAEILNAAFVAPGHFVLKDPRCTTLAPFWERAVPRAGFALRRILIIRDPVEVAESQRQRVARHPNEFPVIAEAEPMAALWAVTMTEFLRALSDDATLMVGHAGLLSAPGRTLPAAAAFAGLAPDIAAIRRFEAEGVKRDLYRARPPAPEPGKAEGAWMTAARMLFADLTRAELPRALPMQEARAIAEAQAQITALLPGLPAVQASIARMQTIDAQRLAQIQALNQMIGPLVALGRRAPEPALSKAIDRATALADSSDIAQTSHAFSLALGRLFLFAGRRTDGLAWLDRVRPQLGHTAPFGELEQKLQDLAGDRK